MSFRDENEILDHLARNVESLRAHYGWSLATVAARAKISKSLTKHIVHRRANPDVAEVLSLANAFGVSIAELVDSTVASVALPAGAPAAGRYDPEGFGAAFGGRLRAYRNRHGFTLQRLVEQGRIGLSTLRSTERGNEAPATRVAVRIARGLGLSFEGLLEGLHSPVLAFSPQLPEGSPPACREILSDSAGADRRPWIEEVWVARRQTQTRLPLAPGSTVMTYVLEGSVSVSFEGTCLTMKRGEAALLSADRQFAITGTSARAAGCLLILQTLESATAEE